MTADGTARGCDLPAAVVSISCGSCGDDLEHDGDVFYCDECGLEFDNDVFAELPARYRDDEQPQLCGHPHPEPTRSATKPFHTGPDGVVVEWRTTTSMFRPCTLPAGHRTRYHHHPLDARFEYSTEKRTA